MLWMVLLLPTQRRRFCFGLGFKTIVVSMHVSQHINLSSIHLGHMVWPVNLWQHGMRAPQIFQIFPVVAPIVRRPMVPLFPNSLQQQIDMHQVTTTFVLCVLAFALGHESTALSVLWDHHVGTHWNSAEQISVGYHFFLWILQQAQLHVCRMCCYQSTVY